MAVGGANDGACLAFDPESVVVEPLFTLRASNLDKKDGIVTRFEGRLGDINGDGVRDDGYSSFDPATYKTSVIICFGAAGRFDFDPAAPLDGNNGFRIVDTRNIPKSYLLDPVSVGDVNGDGIGDFIVASYSSGNATPWDDYSGELKRDTSSFVIFGRKGAVAATFDVADIDGTNGFAIDGLPYNERLGYAASSAGDINGDGFDDVLIGAPGPNIDGMGAGRSYVVFGKAGGFTPSIDVTRLDGHDGFKIAPANGPGGNGLTVAAAGDVNGDGLDDFLVGEPGDFLNDFAPNSATYVVFGRKSGYGPVFDLKGLDGRNGFKVTSPPTAGGFEDDNVGISIASAGDVNGDGFDDVLVGVGIDAKQVPGQEPTDYKQATAYVVFGNGKPIGPELRLDRLDGTNGFEIDCGTYNLEALGVSVSTAGDFNGDGFDDVLVGVDSGAYRDSENYPAKGIIVFGKANGFAKKVSADGLFEIDNLYLPPSDSRPFARTYLDVTSVGDTNGDGFDDVVIGGFGSKSYLIYGRDIGRNGIVQVGDGRANTLVGGTGNDTLRGLGGSDRLDGGGRDDVLDGGSGADWMAGGSGNDDYLVDDAGDRVIEARGQGQDRVLSSVSYALTAGQEIETLQLLRSTGKAALNLTGNEFANTLRGNAGNNRLNGGAGDDLLVSSGGKDVLIGSSGSDGAIIDRSGAKVALSFVMKSVNGTTTLVGDGTTTTSIGNITLKGGSGHDTFVTLNGIDTLDGGAGNDWLDGGSVPYLWNIPVGGDRLIGGTGNDTLIVDDGNDVVIEALGGGSDRVLSSASYYTLAAGQEIEALSLSNPGGRASRALVGNEFDQTLTGNNGTNLLDGKLGSDVLTGRGGSDAFLFSTALGSTNVDRITDFATEDTLRLSKSIFKVLASGQLPDKAFKILDNAKIDADDRILYSQKTGELFYDADGSGNGAAVKFAVLDNKAAITAADFFIV